MKLSGIPIALVAKAIRVNWLIRNLASVNLSGKIDLSGISVSSICLEECFDPDSKRFPIAADSPDWYFHPIAR